MVYAQHGLRRRVVLAARPMPRMPGRAAPTELGAPVIDVPDMALLERLLARLRDWNPDPEPRRRTPGAPQFGATCRRARPGDPPADLTLPGGDL
jgi:hypothetical protein